MTKAADASVGKRIANRSACPDLAPSLALNPATPQLNQQFTIQATIKNLGDADAGHFRAYLYVDPAQQPPTVTTSDTTSTGTFGLAPQSQFAFEYDFTFTMTGTHTIYLWVDRDNQVTGECNENNNLVSLSIPVGVDIGCTRDPYEAGNGDNICATAPRIATDGSIQRHNLCAVGDQDWVSFEGLAGVEYTIVAGNVEDDADIRLELFGQCNQGALRSEDPTLGKGARMQQTLTKTGVYYLQVQHHNPTYGPKTGYDLSVKASCSADGYEPDNQCNLAHELQPSGQPQRHSFCGKQDGDWLLVQGVAGTTYQISTQNWEAKSQPVITLYNECDGDAVNQATPRNSLTWTPTKTAPFWLRILNNDPTVEGLDTGYDLVVTKQPQSGDAAEPNDTPAQAKPLAIGATLTQQSFSFPGDQDWFFFDVTANQSIRFETFDLAASTDSYLCIYGADTSSALACDDDSGAGLGSKLLWQAPTTGRYYLSLRHYSAEAGGKDATYTLTSTLSNAQCDLDPFEPDNQYEQARDITLNAPARIYTLCDEKDEDWARFDIQTSGVYELRAEAQGADADPWLTLYDTDGKTVLFTNDDYTSGLSARILWRFSHTGVYYLRMRSFSAQANGKGTEYALSIKQSQELPTPLPTTPPPPTPTNTPSPTPSPTPTATSLPEATPTPSGPIKTLIVTHQKRFAQVYGAEQATTLYNKLNNLAQYPQAPGIIADLSEEFAVNQAYNAWDETPTNADKANAVAVAIRSVIWNLINHYPQIENIVLIGDDRLIPYRREQDGLTQSGLAQAEQAYATQNLSPNTTVGQAMRQNFTLLDDFYATSQLRTVHGMTLYLPEKAIGRLIETPQEIGQTIDRFLQQDSLNRSTALVIGSQVGYPDRIRSFQQICASLQKYLQDSAFCKTSASAWGQADFQQWHLAANPVADIHLIGARARHWFWEMGDQTKLEANAAAVASTNLTDRIVLAVGSHAGLNVPDNDIYPLDWPQFYTQRGAILIGNSASELSFKTAELGLTHKLFEHLATQLYHTKTLGDALIKAKAQYWQEASKPAGSDPSLADRQILHEVILYNLPMYRLPAPLASDPDEYPSVRMGVMNVTQGALDNPVSAAASAVVTGSMPLYLTHSFASLTLSNTAAGQYYALDGHVNWKPNQAGQPLYRLDLDVTPLGALGSARGILWLGGTYTDALNSNLLIPQVVADGQVQGKQVAANSVVADSPLPAQLDPTGKHLSVEWGQYTPAENRQRLYGSLGVELTFSNAPDVIAPTVLHSAAQANNGGVVIKLEANDASGIRRVVAVYTDGAGVMQSLDLTYHPDAQKWLGTIPGVRDVQWFAQVMDGAGNVTDVLDKGKFFHASYQPNPTSPAYTNYLPVVMK
ncbi:MAG: CARDB domain-containing protein [Caldilineaceae bacterium]